MSIVKLGRLEAELSPGRVVLRGRIDDSAALGELASQVAPGDVTVNTDAVTFINSIGMREWMRFVRALRSRGRVTFERVAAVLITQMNLLPEFDSATITSFHAPYACESCGAEALLLVDALAHAQDLEQMRAPKLPCPECRQPMELADFPERYLSVFKA